MHEKTSFYYKTGKDGLTPKSHLQVYLPSVFTVSIN